MQQQLLYDRIKENRYDYDAYQELLKLINDPVEKQSCRVSFHENFPLDENTWKAWLQDLNNKSPLDENDNIWFETSVKDYCCPSLFVLLCERIWKTSKDEIKTRKLFTECSKQCGYHQTQGHLIWKAWIEFEKSINNNSDLIEYPMRRLATTPLFEIETYWKEYCEKYPNLFKSHEDKYVEALNLVENRKEFENKILKIRKNEEEIGGSAITASNLELEEEWNKYLDFEKKQRPRRIPTILFERSISDCCLSSNLWKRYLLEIGNEGIIINETYNQICIRACRNIPTNQYLWSLYLESEFFLKNFQLPEEIFQTSKNLFVNENPSELYYTMIYLIQEKYKKKKSKNEDEFLLKKLEDEYYQEYLKINNKEVEIKILFLQVKFYYSLLLINKNDENLEKKYSYYWNQIHRLNPKYVGYWIDHIQEEIHLNLNLDRIRKLYTKAMHSLQGGGGEEDLQYVTQHFLQFEQSQIKELFKIRLGIETKRRQIKNKHDHDEVVVKKIKNKRTYQDNDDNDEHDEHEDNNKNKKKLKLLPNDNNNKKEQVVVNEEKIIKLGNKPFVIFIESLSEKTTEESLKLLFEEKLNKKNIIEKIQIIPPRPNSEFRKRTLPYCYIQFTGSNKQKIMQDAINLSEKIELDGIILKIFQSNPPKKKQLTTTTTTTTTTDNIIKKPSSSFLPRSVMIQKKKT